MSVCNDLGVSASCFLLQIQGVPYLTVLSDEIIVGKSA